MWRQQWEPLVATLFVERLNCTSFYLQIYVCLFYQVFPGMMMIGYFLISVSGTLSIVLSIQVMYRTDLMQPRPSQVSLLLERHLQCTMTLHNKPQKAISRSMGKIELSLIKIKHCYALYHLIMHAASYPSSNLKSLSI